LIFFAIGTIIESSKIGIEYIGQLWLFVRWFTALGALVMLYGYLKK
jgi:hypothetical protein